MKANLKTPHWLVIADGSPLPSHQLKHLAKGRRILALDGAYSIAQEFGLETDVLLGDFDTIHPEDLLQAKGQGIHIIQAPDQNKTDLEKGLDYLHEQNPHSIIISCALGKRLQHSLFNLRLLKKFHQEERPIILVSEMENIRYVQDTEISIQGKINGSIGLLGFPEATITTQGLKYDVRNYALQFEKTSSICNALAETEAFVQIQGGVLLIQEESHSTK